MLLPQMQAAKDTRQDREVREKKKLTKILDGKSNPKNDLALNEKLKV